MPALNIIGNILFPRTYGIGGVEFDTILSEEHYSEVAISRNPVETGLSVTDNIAALPQRLVIEGVVTSSSSAFGLVDYGIQGAAAGLANKLGGAFGKDFGFGQKVRNAWDLMLAMQQQGGRFIVETQLKVYGNMAIVSLTTKQDKQAPDHIRFTVSLQEVLIVQTAEFEGTLGDLITKTPSATGADSATADRGAGAKDAGKIAGKKVPPTSYLKEGFNFSGLTSAPAALEVLRATA